MEGVREQRSEAVVDGFSDDDYMVQTNVKLNSGSDAEIFVRYQDAHNAYRVRLDSSGNLDLDKVVNGYYTSINSTTYTTGTCRTVAVNLSGTSIKVWVQRCGVAPSLKITATDSAIASGGVALGGDQPKYDNLKIGKDNSIPSDGEMDDGNDVVIINETFGSTDVTYAYDHAGNLVSDGRLEYVYDAWNRLVKVQSAAAIQFPPVYQTAEFLANGNRAKKTATNSGEHDKTEVYLYDGQKIIETRDGSGNMVSQFLQGTDYIDELVMMRVKDKGDLYVHQDANWNVIGLTDLGGSLVERYDYTPYGTIKVHQLTSYGDRDGDNDVDATDKGTPGTTCTGTVAGACRILDLDFDGDYDSTDATKFDALAQGISQHPGRRATGVHQPFGHQGLLNEPELSGYQNRGRQYTPHQRRFLQRDAYRTSNPYQYEQSRPCHGLDPSGWILWHDIWPMSPTTADNCQPNIQLDVYGVNTNEYNPIHIQKWGSGQMGLPSMNFNCHGYTFNAWIAPTTPGGPWGIGYPPDVTQILDDEWKQVRCCVGTIYVLYDSNDSPSHSGKLIRRVRSHGIFQAALSMGSAKRGWCSWVPVKRYTILSEVYEYGGKYRCFRTQFMRPGGCCGFGSGETKTPAPKP